MDTFDSIKIRRSVRHFTGEQIPVSDLKKIIDAGRLAPAGTTASHGISSW